MKKVIFHLIKYSPFLIGIYLVLFKFDETLAFISNVIKSFSSFLINEPPKKVIITLIVSLLLIGLALKVIMHFWYKFKISALDFKKNTNSKGNARWSNDKEIKKSFQKVEYNKHKEVGFIIERYKEYNILGKKYKVPYFKEQENKESKKDLTTNQEIIEYMNKNEKRQNVALDFLKNRYKDIVILDINPVHILLIGTTRSGKTQTFILPQIDLYSLLPYDKKPNLVITDPKGELFTNTSQILEKRDYEIKVINLKDFDMSHSYNLLELINTLHKRAITKYEEKTGVKVYIELEDINLEEYFLEDTKENRKLIQKKLILQNLSSVDFSETEKEILKFSTSLIPEEGNDPTWSLGAQGLLSSYIKLIWEESFINNTLDTTFNIYSVLTEVNKKSKVVGISSITAEEVKIYPEYELFIKEKIKNLTDMQKELEIRGKTHFSRLNHPKNFEGKNYNSIEQQLRAKTQVLVSEGLGKLSSRNQIDLNEIREGEKPYAIFLITPDDDKTFNIFVSTFITQLYSQLVDYADTKGGGKLDRKCIFLLEEFANIPKIPDFTSKLTVCLGRGIQFMIAVQNITQIKEIYGENDTTTILDNTHDKLYLLAGDDDTRKWFSEQLGNYTIVSKNVSGQDYDEMSVTQSEEEKELMSAYNLNPMGQVIGSITKMNPIKGFLRPAYQYMQNQQRTPEEYFKANTNKHKNISKDDMIL